MSETTKRQAYVFLDTSKGSAEKTIDGDEYLNIAKLEWYKAIVGAFASGYHMIRRPIATPEQTAGLTVWDEYALKAFDWVSRQGDCGAMDVAEYAKNIANAMMKARAQK
jgi:hypothetical protein